MLKSDAAGPVKVEDYKIAPPPRAAMKENMEALITISCCSARVILSHLERLTARLRHQREKWAFSLSQMAARGHIDVKFEHQVLLI